MFLPLLLSRGLWRDMARYFRAAVELRMRDPRQDRLSLPIRISDQSVRR